MLILSERARAHFRRLVEQEGIAELGVRLKVLQPGTPQAECRLEFCEPTDLRGDEWALACEGFNFYVESAGVPYLEGAAIDYEATPTGGRLSIHAPKLKGNPPGAQATLTERVRYVLDNEINPQIAAHGGRVVLEEVTAEGEVVLRFGGGCHGCGMVDVTLRQGIERTLRARVPQIVAVRDATDHSGGRNPYYRGRRGESALR
jgi:Fe/S biogenesis protein NfuA